MTDYSGVLRTLVVDDSEEQCALLGLQLRRLAWIELVGCANDGFNAWLFLHGRTAPRPDLMLLDLNMPRCTGLELLKMLQTAPERPRVVLWSDALRPSDRVSALELGADLVCAKPNTFKELISILEEVALKAPERQWRPVHAPTAGVERRLSATW